MYTVCGVGLSAKPRTHAARAVVEAQLPVFLVELRGFEPLTPTLPV
jgi:hypothetical protein